MSVTVRVPSALRVDAEGAGQLQVESHETLVAIFDEVARRWPRLERRIRDEQGGLRRFVNVYVDGEDCRGLSGLDTPVPAGAEVQILPSIAGG